MNKKISFAIKDFFSKEILKLSIVSFLTSLAVFIVFVILLFKAVAFGFEEFLVYVEGTSEVAILDSIKSYLASFSIFKYLLAVEFFSFLFDVVIFLNVLLLLYFSFMFIYSLVIAFFADKFVKIVQKRHYSGIELKGISIFYMLWVYFKAGILTLVSLILFFPLFFIPTLNLLLFIPLYYFFHKSLVMDVSSAINSKKEYLKIKKANWFELKFQTLILFLISIIPIFGIILIPFYFIYISHIIFEETQSLRSVS